MIPSLAGSFVSPADAQFQGDYSFLKETLPLDRKALLSADAWRSLAFVLLAAGLLYLTIQNKVKKNVSLTLLGFLILVDMFPVAKRYLNENNFESKYNQTQLVKASPADEMIMQDKSQYRVMDFTLLTTEFSAIQNLLISTKTLVVIMLPNFAVIRN